MPKVDPIASLGIWAVEIELAGRVLRIPPLPAGDWLPILMRLDLNGLLRIAEEVDVDEMLLDGLITAEQLEEALTLLLEAASGRPLWTTFALAYIAADNWQAIGGDLARRGVRLDVLPLGAALDAIYGALAANMDAKGVEQLHAALERPSVAPTRRVGPVPASAEPYVHVRPRTVQRRPQDLPPGPSAPPTPPPAPRADSDPGSEGDLTTAGPRPA